MIYSIWGFRRILCTLNGVLYDVGKAFHFQHHHVDFIFKILNVYMMGVYACSVETEQITFI